MSHTSVFFCWKKRKVGFSFCILGDLDLSAAFDSTIGLDIFWYGRVRHHFMLALNFLWREVLKLLLRESMAFVVPRDFILGPLALPIFAWPLRRGKEDLLPDPIPHRVEARSVPKHMFSYQKQFNLCVTKGNQWKKGSKSHLQWLLLDDHGKISLSQPISQGCWDTTLSKNCPFNKMNV